MKTRRAGIAEVAAMSAAATGTTWLATLAWRGFTQDPSGYLVPLLGVAIVAALSGATLRWLRAAGGLVLLGQVAVSGMAVSLLLTGSPVPVGEAGIRLLQEVGTAVQNAQQYRAPVPEEGSVDALLILGGWVCLLLVDFLASTLRRVPLAGLPLLTIYSIPVSMLGGGVAWWAFVLTAAGFLVMLYLQHSDSVNRWGRSLDERESGRASNVRAAAGSVGAAATAMALFLPLLIPTLSFSVFGFGPGDGPGSDVSVDNPMTDLRRDLMRGDDVPLLRVTTQDPQPSYLRIAALNRFNDNEWSTGDRDIPVDQRAQGQLPLPEIDRSVGRTQHDYEITALSEFRSRWLPTQFPLSRISAAGDWRYDTDTLDFLAVSDDLDTAGLTYTFTEVDLDLDAQVLAQSPSAAGAVDSSYRDLPGDFPDSVSSLATEVTRDFVSRYEKAVALQNWFREDGGFTYSLDNVPQGNGPDELVQFLTEGENGRTGYCEQFASAMAAMARSLGIPARVAVGFLVPERVGPDTYEYSSDDMHAWPELYFTGAGWVRFEPTPSDRASSVPSYTDQQLPQAPANQPAPGQSTAPGPDQSQGPDPRLDEGTVTEDDTTTADGGFPLAQVSGTVAGIVVLVLLLLLPRTVRHRQTVARLSGEPEPAWAELRATARDLGVPWPPDRSPRQTRDHLVPHLGSSDPQPAGWMLRGAEASPEGVAALGRLVLALERLRYSPRAFTADAEEVVADARTVIVALQNGADDKARRRARWWPASVLPWRRAHTTGGSVERVLVRHGSVVDHVG